MEAQIFQSERKSVLGNLLLAVLAVILFPFMALAQTTDDPQVTVTPVQTVDGLHIFKVQATVDYNNHPYTTSECVGADADNNKLYDVKLQNNKTCTGSVTKSEWMSPSKYKNYQVGSSSFLGWELKDIPQGFLPFTDKTHFTNPDGTTEQLHPLNVYARVENNQLLVAGNAEIISKNYDKPDAYNLTKKTFNTSVTVVPPPPHIVTEPTVVNDKFQPIELVPAKLSDKLTLAPIVPVTIPTPKVAPSQKTVCEALASTFPKGDQEYCQSLDDDSCASADVKNECHLGGQGACTVTKCLSDYSKAAKSDKIQAAVKALNDAYKVYEQAMKAFGQTMKDTAPELGVTCMQVPTTSQSSLVNAYTKYAKLRRVQSQRSMCKTAAVQPSSRKATTRRSASVPDSSGNSP